jgi:hypothetical protein
MKFLVFHDTKGNIDAIVGRPADAPAASVVPGGGQLVAEVDLPKGTIDPANPDTFQRLVKVIERHRVDVKTEAKLSPKKRKGAGGGQQN